jgi:PKD repeat protein
MRAFNKIIFLGMALVILSLICSTFSCLTDTYAYFEDAKNVDVNLTAATWDSKATLIELPDYKLPANDEKLNGTAFITREYSKASGTGNNSVCENSSNHGSSVNDLMTDFSVAGNDSINLTTNNSTLADGNSRDSLDSSTDPEQPSAVLPVANFSSNVTSGSAPLSVQFIDLSKNATKWNWDFEDGNTSIEQNPIHVYSSSGTYTVNLTISNTNGTDSKLSSISVLEKPAVVLPPVANFSSNVSRGFAQLSIQFTDLSENATVWNWNFGDGNNSTEQNPVHTYSAPGSYIVELAASNENSTNSTFCTITVLQTVLPIANFSSNTTSGHATNAALQSTKTCKISVDQKFCKKRDLRAQKAP